MACRNRKKKQGCVEEFQIPKREDPWALVRKIEAQLAQEKFYHEKTKTENQCEIKTLQAKIRSLERQKKTFLEKLEQNPIEQQHKLEKELNDTSRQLRETTQKLVASQQVIDKLSRSNRGLKKTKEKIVEQFLREIEQNNLLIQNLEQEVKDLKMSSTENEHLPYTDPKGLLTEATVSPAILPDQTELSNEYWQPSDTIEMWDISDYEITQAEQEEKFQIRNHNNMQNHTMEMWDKSEDEITQVEREEKGQTEEQTNMNTFRTLEEKTQVEEDCKVSFFPSMYDCDGNERDKQNPFYQKGFQSLPKTCDASGKTHLNESMNENTMMMDGAKSPEFKLQVNETMEDIKDSKPSAPNKKLKCWNKAKMDMAKQSAHKVCSSQVCEGKNRLKYLYSRITLGSKTDASQDRPETSANREVHKGGVRPLCPPGFNTIGDDSAMQSGMYFLNPLFVEPAGSRASAQNVN